MIESLTRSLQTMLDQIFTAIPTFGYALLILLVGWIIAKVGGGLVARLLRRLHLDQRSARNLGMEHLMTDSSGKKRSLERAIGRIVYYFILLFVVVAFFNALNIPTVTDPINQMLSQFTGAIPNLIEALIILLIAWVIATLVRAGVTRLVQAVRIEDKLSRLELRPEGEAGPARPLSESIGNLAFYVILLFAIPPFLEALGQSAVVTPLRDMFAKAIGFLPNLFSALVIVLIGWIASKVVKEVVSNLLVNVGVDRGAERLGFSRLIGDARVSSLLGYLAYLFILVPAIVAALETLQLRALSEPITVQLTRIFNAIPSLILALIILVAGYVIAQLLKNLVVTFLTNIGFNRLPDRVGLPALVPAEGRSTLSEMAGSVFVAVVMLFVAIESFEAIGITRLADLTYDFILFLPGVFFALALLVGGLVLGNYIKDLINGMVEGKGAAAALIPEAARITLIVFAGAMALQQLGIGADIVKLAFAIIFGAFALALALAVGLGSKDLAGQYMKDLSENLKKQPKK